MFGLEGVCLDCRDCSYLDWMECVCIFVGYVFGLGGVCSDWKEYVWDGGSVFRLDGILQI